MATLVDANVLLDIVEQDPRWAAWSASTLDKLAASSRLLINPVIYTEVSIGFSSPEEVEFQLGRVPIHLHELSTRALFRAGKAFLEYRRRGGTRTAPLPDFFIGAQAEVEGWPLVTRDKGRYHSYFPSVELITPGAT